MRDRIGFDGVAQAMSGAVYLAGEPDQPTKAMVPVVDFGTAMSCALGTMMALYERKSSGVGQEVSGSLMQIALNMASGQLIEEAHREDGRVILAVATILPTRFAAVVETSIDLP